jgi:hypothetical protein
MMSYRFARRSFLAAIGGAVGLKILLQNMEAAAQGAGPPPRFLMMNWPCGVMKYAFNPTNPGTAWTASSTFGQPGYILEPFTAPELKPISIFLQGMDTTLTCPGGGIHEAGTPFVTTGANSPGTRSNGGEADDGVAGGPSWDQILLKHCAGLSKKDANGTIIGKGFFNTIADNRIDSNETSTRCLSYGYTKVSIQSASGGGMIQENQPLRPEMSPLNAYTSLFMGVMGGGGGTNMDALRLLKQKKSVLDHSSRELERLRLLAPAAERVKIDAHMQIIRQLEAQLSEQINNPPMTGGCMLPTMPPSSLKGGDGNASYGNGGVANTDDSPNHEAVGMAHANILRAAFACDIIRVGTFEWSPGTNHVSFKGCNPEEATKIYMHHPLSHQNLNSGFMMGQQPGTASNPTGSFRHVWNGMVGVQRWYFEKTANFLKQWVATVDPLATDGSSLMDRTIVAMISEVGNPSHDRKNAGAGIIGGKKLGMSAGQFKSVGGHHNQVWATIAQAYLGADWESILSGEVYRKDVATPISGLWAPPA